MIKLIHLLKEIIQEATKDTTTVAVRDLLQNTDKVEKHSDSKRVKNKNKLTSDQFKEILGNTLDIDLGSITVVPSPSAYSGKFAAFEFPYKNGQAAIILAGEQRGETEEHVQKSSLQSQIEAAIAANNGKAITIQLANTEEGTYKIGKGSVRKVEGNLMADLAVDDKIFIQHKQERYQQMSGFIKTETKGKISPEAKKEMSTFVQEVKDTVGNVMPPRTGIKKKVVSSDLIRAALFGSTEGFGIDKVQLICQGSITLVPIDEEKGVYTIKGSTDEQTLTYWDTTIPAKWEPYMIARYSSTSGHNQHGIKNCRFNFAPKTFYPGAADITPEEETEEVG